MILLFYHIFKTKKIVLSNVSQPRYANIKNLILEHFFIKKSIKNFKNLYVPFSNSIFVQN